MTTLLWIIAGGVGMSVIALVGIVSTLVSEETMRRLLLPLVALSAGSLLGGALFHMLPEAVAHIGNEMSVYLSLMAGFVTFFLLEQFLQWHHSHRPDRTVRRPLGYLILLADALHNFIGGLAVGGAFMIDLRVGAVTWLVAALHEIPQELGDFGVLVHSGWRRGSALVWNFVTALTFLPGSLLAYWLSDHFDVALLVPFAAGNFIYIGASDLIPELAQEARLRDKLETTASLIIGLAILLLATRLG